MNKHADDHRPPPLTLASAESVYDQLCDAEPGHEKAEMPADAEHLMIGEPVTIEADITADDVVHAATSLINAEVQDTQDSSVFNLENNAQSVEGELAEATETAEEVWILESGPRPEGGSESAAQSSLEKQTAEDDMTLAEILVPASFTKHALPTTTLP